MASWKIKEFAYITEVTIRTLHHYDRIGLLKPSFRQDNGYRLYTDKDLVLLQQILALKFFGFDLKQIKKLLKQQIPLMESLQLQEALLQEKITIIVQAHHSLQTIIAQHVDNQGFAWENILALMKVYKVMQQKEQVWVTRFLNQHELQEYALLTEDLEQRFGKNYGEIVGRRWQQVIAKVQQYNTHSPLSNYGQDAALACVQFVQQVYGKKYAYLSRIIWEKGFKGHKIDDSFALTSEMIVWLDQAIDGYYAIKIHAILSSIKGVITDDIQNDWDNLMNDMCGSHREITQKEIIHQALAINEQYPVDQQISSVAITWLQSMIK